LLFAMDAARNGHSAGTPRYLMPMHLGALIAIAYLFSQWLTPTAKLSWKKQGTTLPWRGCAIAFLITVSIVSGLILQPSPYLKSRNLSNPDLTAILNGFDAPQVILMPHYVNDVISLSYRLKSDTDFYVLPEDTASPVGVLEQLGFSPRTRTNPETIAQPSGNRPTLLFAPSDIMIQAIAEQNLGELTKLYEPPPIISGMFKLTLWQINR
ncbi:MAG: hypothetical protein AAFY72_17785, partial [Cyanobacteria bacterium J06649_4]